MDGQKLRTPFTEAFTARFIGDPTRIKDPGSPGPWPDPEKAGDKKRVWPAPGQQMPGIIADYEAFVHVLMTLGNGGALPPPDLTTLAGQIQKFIQDNSWPSGSAVPPEYAGEKPTVHLVEIAVILDRLLAALNSFDPTGGGRGGDGSHWPPH